MTQESKIDVSLTQRELAALVHRLVPEGTWMGAQAARVVGETFETEEEAQQAADEVTMRLIRLHDRSLCACAVHEEPDGERIRVHCNEHCPRVLKGDWDRCMGC